MALRVLVIGTTYIIGINRGKWRVLATQFGAEVRVIVPRVWPDLLFLVKADLADPHGRPEPFRIRALPTWFAGNEPKYCFRSLTVGLGGYQPDILHVEQGDNAFSYFQALALKRLLAPRAKAVFFTWMNRRVYWGFPWTFFERYNLSHSDGAIVGNKEAMKILQDKGFRKPMMVLPQLGVDTTVFSKRDESVLRKQLALTGCVVGFVGRLVPEKGVTDLVEAAAGLHGEWSLLFVGSGPLEEDLKTRARALGVGNRVKFTGSVPNQEVSRYMNCIDLLVLPSRTTPAWAEQFGHVLVEAMACRVPVIGSSSGAIPDVIGDAGVIFQEGHTEELGRILSRLAEDRAVRAEMGEKGRRRVESVYTDAGIAARLYEFYGDILNKPE